MEFRRRRARVTAYRIDLGMGGRAVECTGLENRQRRKSLVGSNPTPSVCEPDTIVADKRSRGLEAFLSGVAQKPVQARRTPACVIWAHARSSEPSVFIPRQPDSTTVTS